MSYDQTKILDYLGAGEVSIMRSAVSSAHGRSCRTDRKCM